MREYIKRYHEPDKVEYLHPVFKEHLGETFGVMVYQEDVMKIVHHFADLDLDESDVLRRIMTGKKKTSDTFRKLMEKFWRNCRTRGYPEELISEVWRQVESFSGYSFCKAHSASFAVESFQSLYLKTYYPLEFMVGVINNFGGFYQTEYYVESFDAFVDWAATADVVLNLRYPTLGETSGAALRVMAAGRPLVVFDHGWYGELPDEAAVKVPPLDDLSPDWL